MAAEKEWERKSHALLFYWRKQKAALLMAAPRATCSRVGCADFAAQQHFSLIL
jgi:hypothetical protein